MTHDCARRRFLGTVAAAAAATGRSHIGLVANAVDAAVEAITAEVNQARAYLERTIG